MKKLFLAVCFVMVSGCSDSNDSSLASATASQIPDLGAYTVRFVAKDRCLTVPFGKETSGRYVTGSNPYRHFPCGSGGQDFLFKQNDIKEAGAFGAYVTEANGKVVAGASSPWTVLTTSSGAFVVQSQSSGKCLVADRNSDVVLGACNDANAVVTVSLTPVASSRGNGPVVACSTDNQGNAVDCI